MPDRSIADRYDLLDRLGQGGGGTVWRAHDRSLDRVVALKEIVVDRALPEADRERARARALREARAAARLEHRHAVSVYDVRSDDDAIHIVMEFVDAPSLQQLVERDGPMSPAHAAALGVEVLDALAAAHEAGIVHRDVKPSNVLVSADGARVTDFGIASVMGDTSALTLSGEALGTPDYVSPEQVRGDEATSASDVWSLGATLYMAVEGAPPFRRDRPVSTVHAVVHDDPRPTARAGALGPVLQSMLAKDPGDRPGLLAARSRLTEVVQGTAGLDATEAIAPVALDRTQVLPPADAAPPPPATSTDTTPPPPVAPSRPPTSGHPEHPAPPPQDTGGRRRGVTAGVALFAVATLVVAAVLVTVLSDGGDGGPEVAGPSPTPGATTEADPDPAEPAPTVTETATPASPSPTETSPSPSPTADETTPEEPDAELPDGWELYEGPTYAVGHPAGWTTRDTGIPNNVDLVAPDDTAGYLRVAHTDDPAEDVVQDSERIEAAFQDNHPDYERIRLEPVDYRDTEAAIWEYTFTEDGQAFHAIHLNMSTGERGYALNHVVPEAGWDEAADRFEEFTESFTYP